MSLTRLFFLCGCVLCAVWTQAHESTQSSGSLELTLEFPEKGGLGREFQVSFRLKNKSDKPLITLVSTTLYQLQLKTSDGVQIPLSRYGVSLRDSIGGGSRRQVKIENGEEYKEQVNLARIFDLTVPDKYILGVICIKNNMGTKEPIEFKEFVFDVR